MPLLRVLTVCPGTDWVPGQTVHASAEQAARWADGIHTELIRAAPLEQATRGGRRRGR